MVPALAYSKKAKFLCQSKESLPVMSPIGIRAAATLNNLSLSDYLTLFVVYSLLLILKHYSHIGLKTV